MRGFFDCGARGGFRKTDHCHQSRHAAGLQRKQQLPIQALWQAAMKSLMPLLKGSGVLRVNSISELFSMASVLV